MSWTADNDDECIRRALRGDSDAFNELYDRHTPVLIPFVARWVSGHDIHDIIQEVWLRVYSRLSSFHEGDFRSWVFTIARNILKDRSRREEVRKRATPDLSMRTAIESVDPRDRIADDSVLAHCLKTLSPLMESVVRDRLTGRPYTAICGKHDISVDKAYQLVHQSIKRLRACIEQESS